MGFSKLNYTRDWRNEDDFPAVETDEKKVREDQQLLFDEVKEHVNKVADELDAEKQRVDNTMATKEELRNLATTGVADGAVTPEKLSPETLDRSYTKDETWTDETKAEYGMESDAVPDAALSALAPLLHNWWAKKKEKKYKEVFVEDATASLFSTESPTSATLYYADNYAVDAETGKFRLLNATEFTIYWDGSGVFSQLAEDKTDLTGKYVAAKTEGLSYLVKWRSDTTYNVYQYSDPYYFTAMHVDVRACVVDDLVPTEFQHSVEHQNPVDGGKYTALGELLVRAAMAPKMSVGEVIGLGGSRRHETVAYESEVQLPFEPMLLVGGFWVAFPALGKGFIHGDNYHYAQQSFDVNCVERNKDFICRLSSFDMGNVPSGPYFAIGL